MDGAAEIIRKVKEDKLVPTVVTGSGQASLLNRLEENFPDTFQEKLMVTAFDVQYGKPHPEPYLMALKKGGLKPNEAIVIENAPLGVDRITSYNVCYTKLLRTYRLRSRLW